MAAFLCTVLVLALVPWANAEGICDIYLQGGTPCVAAHSMTRALYSNYSGSLYRLVALWRVREC